jgi:hypothetical protein
VSSHRSEGARGSSVGIVTRLRAERSGVRRPAAVTDFFPPKTSRRLRYPQQPSLLFSGYRRVFSEVKRPQHEAYYLSPSATKVNNEWSCTSTPLVCPDGVDRDRFAFTLLPHSDVFKFVLFCCQDWRAKCRNFIRTDDISPR